MKPKWEPKWTQTGAAKRDQKRTQAQEGRREHRHHHHRHSPGPQSVPKDPQRAQESPKRDPREPQGSPKRAQESPKRGPEEPRCHSRAFHGFGGLKPRLHMALDWQTPGASLRHCLGCQGLLPAICRSLTFGVTLVPCGGITASWVWLLRPI